MRDAVAICVVGSGYVGLVASACLAEIGHTVVCVDNDAAKIEGLRHGDCPIFEQHLPELLARHRGDRLTFTTELGEAVRQSEAIFIAVGTPQEETGAADLSYVEAVVSEIARAVSGYKAIIEKSTVPVYTNEWISRVLQRYGVAAEDFDVISNPEFLREGTAVRDFLHPDRIVVGTTQARAATLMQRIYAPLTEGSYYAAAGAIQGARTTADPAPLLLTTAQSAEIIKHASNAFLALKISFINAVANLAETVNGNIEDIAAGIGMDARIGADFLKAGIGYGGSCFPKDVAAFHFVAQQHGVNFQLLQEVRRINDEQRDRFFNKVRDTLWTLRGKRLGVLGLAYKGGTDDIRESPAIDLVKRFLAAGAHICAYDPAAIEPARSLIGPDEKMAYAADAYRAAQGADALLILADWQEFAVLDLQRIHAALQFPIVIDGRNLYRPETMAEAGFTYISMGRPAVERTAESL